MEKLYATRIRREIEEIANNETDILDFTFDPSDVKKSDNFRELEGIAEDERDYIKRKDRDFVKNGARINAIHSMLKEGRWSQSLAVANGIKKNDLIQYYHTLRELRRRLIAEGDEEWKQEVLQKGRQFLKEEKEKAEKFKERIEGATPLRRLLAYGSLDKNKIPPFFILMEQLEALDSKIQWIGAQIDLVRREMNINQRDSSLGDKLLKLGREKKDCLENKIHVLKQIQRDPKSIKRFTLINALSKEQLESEDNFTTGMRINSMKHGFDLLSHFVHWYNSKNLLEILGSQEENKKETDKAYYDAKPTVQAKREEKVRKKERVYELSREGLSQQEIVDQLSREGIALGKSTVGRWLQELI